MAREIEVIIEKGTATVTTRGFQGKACQDATAQLEQAMGLKTQDTRTPEFDVKTVRTVGS